MQDKFSDGAVDVIAKLLTVNPRQRLGMLKRRAVDVKEHYWFKESKKFSWDKLQTKTLAPPYVPEDQSYEQNPRLSEIDFDGGNSGGVFQAAYEETFKDF